MPINLSMYYTKVKSANKLRPKELSLLRDICIWREEKARKLDIPRNRVASDSELLNIILRKIDSVDDFVSKKIFCSKRINLYAKEILEILKEISLTTQDKLPMPLKRKVLS